MHKIPVSVEAYLKKKEEGEGFLPLDIYEATDLYGGCVPLDVTQESKGSSEYLNRAGENIKERFGLN